MDLTEFEELILQALDELPEELREPLANLEIEVDELPSRDDLERAQVGNPMALLGLYYGVPLTQVGRDRVSGLMPDMIKIYKRPIEAVCLTAEDIKEKARKVILHEVGHRFGITDERLRELDMY